MYMTDNKYDVSLRKLDHENLPMQYTEIINVTVSDILSLVESKSEI